MSDSIPSAPISAPTRVRADNTATRSERKPGPGPSESAPAGTAAVWLGRFLTLGALALIWASFKPAWWMLKLYAPQYPHGLTLTISLSGVAGDVREINMLNHYIGMAQLDAAAVFERSIAGYAIAGLMLVVAMLMWFRARWAGWLAAGLAATLPLGFLVDAWAWLYLFGHQLDRRAPLHIPAFTPQLFGNGTIGQFMTFATPQIGFWLATAASVLLFAAALLRRKSA